VGRSGSHSAVDDDKGFGKESNRAEKGFAASTGALVLTAAGAVGRRGGSIGSIRGDGSVGSDGGGGSLTAGGGLPGLEVAPRVLHGRFALASARGRLGFLADVGAG